MSFIKKAIKKINNEMATIVSDGTYADLDSFINTGCYILNAQLSGSIYQGLPNTIIGLGAPSSCGKTYLMLSIVKHFLNENKHHEVVLFETEGAINKKMLEERGIDSTRVALIPVQTVEEFKMQSISLLKDFEESKDTKTKLLFGLDSLGNLASEKEVKDAEEGKTTADMTRAKQIKSAFRLLTLRLAKLKIPMIVTNHVYEQIGAWVPTKVQGGGTGLVYCASIILELSKKKDKDGTEVVGNIIKSKMFKGRTTKENSMIEMNLNYATGLDKYYGLLDIAMKYGIFQKDTKKILLPDGSSVFEKYIISEPEKYFTKDVLDKIDEACKQEFCYGMTKSPSEVMDGILNGDLEEDDE